MPIRPSLHSNERSLLFYAVLVAVSTIGPLALNIFVPSIPGLMREFSASSGTVQLTLTVYLVGAAVSQLLYGPLSDRYGRRPVMLVGLGLYVIASQLCALATSIEGLMAARFLQAVGGAAGLVLARAIVRDLHNREASASMLGYITMAWVLVPMFAPALGGLLDQAYSWRASFHLLTLVGMAVLALALWNLPETNPRDDRGDLGPTFAMTGIVSLIRAPRFVSYTLTLGLCSAVFFSFLAGAPFILMEVLSHSPFDYGLWFIMVAIGYMTGNFLSGRYSQRMGIDRMIAIGSALAMAGALTILGTALIGMLSPFTLFAPMMIVTLGHGLIVPNGTAAAVSVLPKTIGAAAGLSGFTQISMGAVASQVTGTLQGVAPLSGLWIMASAAILAGLSHQIMTRCYPQTWTSP